MIVYKVAPTFADRTSWLSSACSLHSFRRFFAKAMSLLTSIYVNVNILQYLFSQQILISPYVKSLSARARRGAHYPGGGAGADRCKANYT